MFDLSNAIAYDGLMIDATDRALAEEFVARYPSLPQSKWIDVASQGSKGHWVPAEGVEVDGILAHLDEIGFDFSKAGTIHTAQGNGDRKAWTRHRYFDLLADGLSHYRPREDWRSSGGGAKAVSRSSR